MQHSAADPDASRSSADVRAFREARWLLWVFGVSGLPATLMLATMGIDFLEGDFGHPGTLAMLLAGTTSIVCLVTARKARKAWVAGERTDAVLIRMCWPPLLALAGVFLFMTALAAMLCIYGW